MAKTTTLGTLVALPTAEEPERPKTRGDCVDGPRPCPWVSCRHHLYLDVNPKTGRIQYNHPNIEPEDLGELVETCALDVADGGRVKLEAVGELLGCTRQRAQQLEIRALLRAGMDAKLATHADRQPYARRRVSSYDVLAPVGQRKERFRITTDPDDAPDDCLPFDASVRSRTSRR